MIFRLLCAIWFSGFVGYAIADLGIFKGFCIAAFLGVPMILAFFAGMEYMEKK